MLRWRVAAVAQQEGVRETFRTLLSPWCDVIVTSDEFEAADLNAVAPPADTLIVDIPKSAAPDITWLRQWTRRWPATSVVLSVSFLSDELRALLPVIGPVRILIKPFTPRELHNAVERARGSRSIVRADLSQ